MRHRVNQATAPFLLGVYALDIQSNIRLPGRAKSLGKGGAEVQPSRDRSGEVERRRGRVRVQEGRGIATRYGEVVEVEEG